MSSWKKALNEEETLEPGVFVDGDTIISNCWSPNREQFNVYLTREVEMAKINIANLTRALRGSLPGPNDTLHTSRVFFMALRESSV